MNKRKSILKSLFLILTIALIMTLLSSVVSMAYEAIDNNGGSANSGSGSGNKTKIEAATGLLFLLAVGIGLAFNEDLYKNSIVKDVSADESSTASSQKARQEEV